MATIDLRSSIRSPLLALFSAGAPLAPRSTTSTTAKTATVAASGSLNRYYTTAFRLRHAQLRLAPLHVGSHVLAGTLLGRLGATVGGREPHLLFQLRPAGARSQLIDPRPFLDSWTQLETIELHRRPYSTALFGPDVHATSSAILLASGVDLARIVLGDTRLVVSSCERSAIAAGEVDRRVLASVEYLAAHGIDASITGPSCNTHATAGLPSNVDSVTLTALNGISLSAGAQVSGVATRAVRLLRSMSASTAPTQIFSSGQLAGTTAAHAAATDAGRILISYKASAEPRALASTAALSGGFALSARRWTALSAHLEAIAEPRVPTATSAAATAIGQRARTRH